jgi:hypothetical protein
MSTAASSMPPFLPGDRVKRGGIFMHRQLGKRLHCVRDCVLIVSTGYNGLPCHRWFVGIVGITASAKASGTEEGRFIASDIILVIRKGTHSHA